MKNSVLVILCVIFTFFSGIGALTGQGIQFNEPFEISQMMERYISQNKSKPSIKGWRIQIVSTDDRRVMERARSEFNALYPEMETSWRHLAPYYQVRVGAYRNKTELMAFLMNVKEDFPTATPVVDDIDKTEFIR